MSTGVEDNVFPNKERHGFLLLEKGMSPKVMKKNYVMGESKGFVQLPK
jgi:hypothetical protein